MEPFKPLYHRYNVLCLKLTSNVESPIDVWDVRSGDVLFTDIERSQDAILLAKTSFAIEGLKGVKENITTSYLGYLNGWKTEESPLDKRDLLKLIEISSKIESILWGLNFELEEFSDGENPSVNDFSDLDLHTWFYTSSQPSSSENCRYFVRDVDRETSRSRLICSTATVEDASFALLTPSILSLLFSARDFMGCLFQSLDTKATDTVLDFSELERKASFMFYENFPREFANNLNDLFKKEEVLDFIETVEAL